MDEPLFWRRGVVFGSAVIYWVGVLVHARRVRRQIGRSPNLRPRGFKERMLWVGWCIVVAVWVVQPFLAGIHTPSRLLRVDARLLHLPGLVLGIVVMGAGYAGTLWCYASMGDTWRIGIDRRERNTLITRGPYQTVRHPIYLFQIVMLAGALVLVPTILSVIILVAHLACVLIKASDEEAYLLNVHGRDYRGYLSHTGRLFPKLPNKTAEPE